jgi:hypothetical protein
MNPSRTDVYDRHDFSQSLVLITTPTLLTEAVRTAPKIAELLEFSHRGKLIALIEFWKRSDP